MADERIPTEHEKKVSAQLLAVCLEGATVEAVGLTEAGICLCFDNGYDFFISNGWTLKLTQAAIDANRAETLAANGGSLPRQ